MARDGPGRLGAVLMALALMLSTASVGFAQNEGIKDTKHNFSAASRDATFNNLALADYGEICVYCHTPHGGQVTAPLWNRTFTASSFTMYNDATGGSADLNMNFEAQPMGVSLACLSCHDGTIGIDVIINKPNASAAVATGRTLTDIYGGVDPDSLKILGTDLRNDHPISVEYDETKDPQFQPLASVTGAGLRLYQGGGGIYPNRVECGTCHNPHSKNATFLRIPNTNSDLCLTCHIK